MAQTSIANYRDILKLVFRISLEDDINWRLLPLGFSTPLDPIKFIQKPVLDNYRRNSASSQFLAELAAATKEIEDQNLDTGRLLTVYSVKLESIKKIERADFAVGVKSEAGADGPLLIQKLIDPNVTHPLRQKEVLAKIGPNLHGIIFNSFTFQAIVWKFKLKDNDEYCWRAREGILTKYSNDLIQFIEKLSQKELSNILSDYRKHRKHKRKRG